MWLWPSLTHLVQLIGMGLTKSGSVLGTFPSALKTHCFFQNLPAFWMNWFIVLWHCFQDVWCHSKNMRLPFQLASKNHWNLPLPENLTKDFVTSPQHGWFSDHGFDDNVSFQIFSLNFANQESTKQFCCFCWSLTNSRRKQTESHNWKLFLPLKNHAFAIWNKFTMCQHWINCVFNALKTLLSASTIRLKSLQITWTMVARNLFERRTLSLCRFVGPSNTRMIRMLHSFSRTCVHGGVSLFPFCFAADGFCFGVRALKRAH